jgi:hypothetical protein
MLPHLATRAIVRHSRQGCSAPIHPRTQAHTHMHRDTHIGPRGCPRTHTDRVGKRVANGLGPEGRVGRASNLGPAQQTAAVGCTPSSSSCCCCCCCRCRQRPVTPRRYTPCRYTPEHRGHCPCVHDDTSALGCVGQGCAMSPAWLSLGMSVLPWPTWRCTYVDSADGCVCVCVCVCVFVCVCVHVCGCLADTAYSD